MICCREPFFDQGFVVGSFGSGLTPEEFFSHARAGRTSLCDNALQTGYSQTKLIKLMVKLVVYNDGSVRCVCSKKDLQGSIWRRCNRPT